MEIKTVKKGIRKKTDISTQNSSVKQESYFTHSRLLRIVLGIALAIFFCVLLISKAIHTYLPRIFADTEKIEIIDSGVNMLLTTITPQPQTEYLPPLDIRGRNETDEIRRRLYTTIITPENEYPFEITISNRGRDIYAQKIMDFETAKAESKELIDIDSKLSYSDIRNNPARDKLFDVVGDKYLLGNTKIWVYGDGLVIYDKENNTFTAYLFPLKFPLKNQIDMKLELVYQDIPEADVEAFTSIFNGSDTTNRGYFISRLYSRGYNREKYRQLKEYFETVAKYSNKKEDQKANDIKQQMIVVCNLIITTGMIQEDILFLLEQAEKANLLAKADLETNNTQGSQDSLDPPDIKLIYLLQVVRGILFSTGSVSRQQVKDAFEKLMLLQKEMPLLVKGYDAYDVFLVEIIRSPENLDMYKSIYKAMPEQAMSIIRRFISSIRKEMNFSNSEIEKIIVDLVSFPAPDYSYEITDSFLNYILYINSTRIIGKLTYQEVTSIWQRAAAEAEEQYAKQGKAEGFDRKEKIIQEIFKYFTGQEKAGRKMAEELENREIEHVFSFGKTLSSDLISFLYYYPTNLSGISSQEDILKKIAQNFPNIRTKISQELGYYSIVEFMNKLHDWEYGKYKTDNFREILVNNLDMQSTYEIIKDGSFRYGEFQEIIDVIYTSTFEVFYNHLRSFPREKYEKLLENDRTGFGKYIKVLGRYEVLDEEVKENPLLFFPRINDLLNNSQLATSYDIDIYQLFVNGVRAGLYSSASEEYQKMLADLYQSQNGMINRKSVFAAFVTQQEQDIISQGDYQDFYFRESPRWPKIIEPSMPDFTAKSLISSIFYNNKEDVYREENGMPGALEYFSSIGYENEKIDEDNWIITGNRNGKMIEILVTFLDQKKALDIFREKIDKGHPDISFFEQHSPLLNDFFSKPPVFNDYNSILYLGSCGSTQRINYLLQNGYNAQMITSNLRAYPEAGYVLLANLFLYISQGGRDWEKFNDDKRILLDTYKISTPVDSNQLLNSYYREFIKN